MGILENIGSANLVITPFILLILWLMPLIDKKCAPTGRRVLWIMVMVGLVWPFAAFVVPHQPAIPIEVSLPTVLSTQVADNGIAFAPIQHASLSQTVVNPAYTTQAQAAFNLPSADILLVMLWVAGMIVFVLYQGIRHYKLLRRLKRWQIPTSEAVMAIFETEKARMGITNVSLAYVKNFSATMLVGIFRPTVFLADTQCSTEELSLIFRHELIHYMNKDLWYKTALLIARCVYWYNPVVHLMARQVVKDLETVCDYMAVKDMDITERKNYSNLILRMAVQPAYSPLTTHISGGKNMLKQRLTNILQGNRPGNKKIFAMLGVVLIASAVLVGFNFGANAQYEYAEDEPCNEEYVEVSEVTTITVENPTFSYYDGESMIVGSVPVHVTDAYSGFEETVYFHMNMIDDRREQFEVALHARIAEYEGILPPSAPGPLIGIFANPNTMDNTELCFPKTGVLVTGIIEGSGAEAAGMQVGDVILSVNVTTIENAHDLSVAVSSLYIGQEIVLTIYRDGEAIELPVVVGSSEIVPMPTPQEPYVYSHGDAIPLPPFHGDALSLPLPLLRLRPIIGIYSQLHAIGNVELGLPEVGVLVSDMMPGSGAEAAGILVGDVILTIEGKLIAATENLTDVMSTVDSGQEILLTIYRDGEVMDVYVVVGFR